ncbi:MAG: BspA family leucine-rich repeat surface protein [Bacteroides sp.]
MKRIVLLLATLLAALWLASASYAESKPFITKWKGEAGKELKIPIFGKNYKLVIKKASDNTVLKTENSLTITEDNNFYTYIPAEDDELLVEAGPEGVEYICFVDNKSKRGSAENLLTVELFGTVAWKSMYEAFQYCNNMQFATTVDTPDLSKVTDMVCMFYDCSAFNQDISSWNVSKVTDMRDMFGNCFAFNQDISSWNVSKVTDMAYMFYECSAFNQDISGWDVSKVTDMEYMFYQCSAFNQNLGSWQLKECTALGLQNCGMSIENYSKSLIGWAGQADINENLLLKADNLHFNETAKSARTKLMKEKHWIILGDVSEGGKVYYLRVGGVQLSSDNIASFQETLTEVGVLKKGKVSVTLEGEKLILKLENAELTAPYDNFPTYMLESGDSEIQLQGNCTITQLSGGYSAITVRQGTIVGRNTDDKLSVKGGAVYFGTAIRNCTIEVEKTLEGYWGIDLEIDNAIVKAKSITRVDLTLKNCSILQPEGAHYDAAKKEVVDKDGNTAENVVIGPSGGGAVTGITLSQHELTLVKGATATLTATVIPADAPNKNFSWKSDDEAIAKVENGVVTAISKGETIIRVTTEVGSKTDECKVIVKEESDPVAVTGVKLAYNDLTLKIGTSLKLVARIEPTNATNKAVTWSSSNNTVASVTNMGVVQAKAAGTADITVTTADGGHIATCSFTVTAEDVVLTDLKVSPAETHIKVGQAGTLNVKYEPVTATHKEVTWETSDAAIVTVDQNGNIKGVAVGEAVITVKSKQDETIKSTSKVIVDPTTAVEDAVFASVVIAPNPFDNQLRIANGDLRGEYALYNTQGVVVTSGVLEGAETCINTSMLPAGMYLLRLSADNGTMKTYRIVKQ